MKKYLPKDRQLAILQVGAIMQVCLVHSFFNPYETQFLHRWLCAFTIPLFIFLSGFLLMYSQSQKNCGIRDIKFFRGGAFLRKKALRLLLPYFFVSTLVFLPKCLLSAYAMRPVDLSLEAYVHMLAYPWDNVIKFFWYLPTLFIIMILSVVLIKAIPSKMENTWFYMGVLLFLMVLNQYNPFKGVGFLNLEGVAEYWVYFWGGIVYCRSKDWIESKLKFSNPWVCVLFVGIYTFLIWFFPEVFFPFREALYAFLGILVGFSLSGMFLRYGGGFLDHLFGSSYAIYIFSWFSVVAVQFLVERKHLSWELGGLIAFILQIYVSWGIYKIIIAMKQKGKVGGFVAMLFGQ